MADFKTPKSEIRLEFESNGFAERNTSSKDLLNLKRTLK